MKMKQRVFRSIVTIAVAALAFSGCAKKPVEEMTSAPQPVETQMPASEPSGYQDGSFSQTPVGDSGFQVSDSAPGAMDAMEALQRIYFEFDQYTLTPTAQETLTGNAAYLKANPDIKVLVEGHCDERGSDEYNLALGEKRAQAVKNYLVSLGVEGNRLSVISYGEELPLDPGHGEDAWAKNRRAEFKPVL